MSPWSSLQTRYRESRVVRWTVDFGVLGAMLVAIGGYQTRSHPRGSPPEVALTTLDGKRVRLSQYAGKPTLVAVWAPWCGVCKMDGDNISRVRGWLGDRARVISIAAAYGERSAVDRYIREQHVDYPVLLAGPNFQQQLGVHAFPSFFVMDETGRVTTSTQGYTTTLGLWLRVLLGG